VQYPAWDNIEGCITCSLT